MNENLKLELAEDWQLFVENDIDITKPFSILLKYYRADRNSVEAFLEIARQEGYEVETKFTRTLIFLKGTEIYIRKTFQWTLENLVEEVSKMDVIGKQLKLSREALLAANAEALSNNT